MSTLVYTDATNDANDELPHPAWVTALEQLGCHQVGRILASTGDAARDESIVTQFGPEHEDTSRKAFHTPTPILVTPERDVFIDISFWHGLTPSVRLQTILDDGSLVESARRWDVAPPVVAGTTGLSLDIDKQMLRAHAPAQGRSVRVLQVDTADALVREHRRHVADVGVARSAAPIVHETLQQFLELAPIAHDHSANCSMFGARARLVFWTPIFLAMALVIAALFILRPAIGIPSGIAPFIFPVWLGVAFVLGRQFRRLVYMSLPVRLRPRIAL